jgi:hypothetical protein
MGRTLSLSLALLWRNLWRLPRRSPRCIGIDDIVKVFD